LKNLNTKLLYKIIITLLVITLGITYYRVRKQPMFEESSISIKGYINRINKTDDKIQIELISDKKALINYYTKENNIDYNLGDEIIVEGKTTIPVTNTVPNTFNYKHYILSKKINYIINADKIIKVKNNTRLRYILKNKIINHIENYKTSNYLKTFILGDSEEIDLNIKETFQKNGISHLFAVSGMHLSLFSAILMIVLRKLRLKENIISIITIIFFIFFSFLTNYSPSILRALLMFILLKVNKLLNLKLKSIYILLLVLSGLLLFNPFYIYNLGFIFSFTTSASIIIYNNIINNYKHYISKVFITSLIAFLTSIPIMIQNFYEINIITPINNIIFVPLISFIVFPLSLITLFIKPLDNVLQIIINILEFLSVIINKLKISLIISKKPYIIVVLYYIIIIIFINGITTKNYKKILPLILLLIVHSNIKYLVNDIKITILDVGQGDSLIIELKNNKSLLIDTGGYINDEYSIVKNKTINYLKSKGINELKYLILTHGDYDHMGEAINLVENFKVEKIIFNCGEFNELEQDLIKILDKKKIPYYSCIKELNIDNNKLYFLNNKDYGNENDNSSVIYTELNNYKFLFMGDAGVEVEEDLTKKYNLKDIDVLKVGHHGSRTSSSKEFIDEINPKYSIISVGKNNRYGHPNDSVLENLEDSKIYRTDQDGSIMFKIKNNKFKIETCEP